MKWQTLAVMTKSVFADWVWLLEVDGTCRKLIASVYNLLLGKKYIPQTKSLEKKIVLIPSGHVPYGCLLTH